MIDLRQWLDSIECGRYADAFEANDITSDLLAELTDADLRELGMTIGDRKRFARAVAALHPPEPAPAPEPAPPPGPATAIPVQAVAHAHAERRRLTVMFVDLVGSTVLSSRLDPEVWSDVLRDYQDIVAGLVTRLGGHVAQYLGDGALCYFGWPQAHESSAERAVDAGLEIIAAINRRAPLAEPLSCRIGIATGLVVVGELIGSAESGDRTAIGETPNFAARLQAFAKANHIVVSDSTRRLLGNAFILESLGTHEIKGIAKPQTVYAVLRRNPAHDRFSGREGHATGVMVGRRTELALLQDRWALARGGEGQTVLLLGEAGIGKSRISRALCEDIEKERHQLVTLQCSPYHRDIALWPVISYFNAASGIRPDDDLDQRLDKLEALLRHDGVSALSTALIADLMGLDGEARYGAIDLPPSARRAATFRALIDHVVSLARQGPLLVLLEDAHWADPTTEEFACAIVDCQQNQPVLQLITARPENPPGLPHQSYVSSVSLNRLGRGGVQEIVRRLGGGNLPSETIEAIIERTDGVPLFIEELTKAMIESGEMTVPASLHDTLMARLDRLPEVKEIAQIASVFGREFETAPLAEVARLSRERIAEALDQLRKVELVFSRLGGDERHLFKHALVRDAAYESLLNRRRQEIHGRIFEVLRESPTAAPGVLAQHAAEAGLAREAVEYGRQAAEQALRRPAYAEALAHLDAALAAIDGEPEDAFTLRERKRLLLLLGQACIAHAGYAAQKTTGTYAEIERIARRTGDNELLIDGLYGRWAGHYVPGRLEQALDIAITICTESDKGKDGLARALGRRLRGTVLTMMGRVAEAESALDEAETWYDPGVHGRLASRFGQDVGVAARCYRIGCLTLEGRFDTAVAEAERAIADIERVSHAHTAGYGLGHLSCFLSAAEIVPLGTQVTQSCIELSERDGMPLWAALGRASRGMAHLHEGHSDEALPELRAALEMLRRLDFAVFLPMLLPPYALALARAGEFEAAMAEFTDARAMMEANSAHFFWPELARVEGEMHALRADADAAFRCFSEARDRARRLGHLASEFRAAESLADLLSRAGRNDEAREILHSVLDAFVEGRSMPMFRRITRKIEEYA
ncbi:AAA family ATPase [Limibaculum sp. M0105]|uniref:AAA family ATPase n=1 Tax=Thermohalobaculum xanthum TaxID=2753746 RepID=A0A8J7M4F0_9RHOB|nr:adenylate/guanylate cyclase domain-containing protein [Thermohalobaculum xanthum]MBK0398065.1 AAA family ATPase [Thermohalobaculum xanthum]